MNSPTIGAGQRQPDIHPQHRNDPGQAERHDQLAKDLPARGAERIEQLLAVAIERLHARIGGERRHDERQRRGDGDLRGEPHAEHQDHQRRQRQLRQRLEADDVRLHDRGIVARPPERQAEQRAARGAEQKAEDRRTEGEADIGPGVAFGEEFDQRVRRWRSASTRKIRRSSQGPRPPARARCRRRECRSERRRWPRAASPSAPADGARPSRAGSAPPLAAARDRDRRRRGRFPAPSCGDRHVRPPRRGTDCDRPSAVPDIAP